MTPEEVGLNEQEVRTAITKSIGGSEKLPGQIGDNHLLKDLGINRENFPEFLEMIQRYLKINIPQEHLPSEKSLDALRVGKLVKLFMFFLAAS